MTITTEQVIAAIRRLAADNPEHVYQEKSGCFYVNVDRTGGDCIVGQALFGLGVPVEDLAEHEGSGAYSTVPHFVEVSNADDLDWITSVQDGQDVGWTWSRAVQSADEGWPE